MSRPDTHPADYDYLNFDNRDFGIPPHPQLHGPHAGRDWASREQQAARENAVGNSFYHTPSASMPSLSMNSFAGGGGGGGGGGDGRTGNGVPGMVAPRMYGLNPAGPGGEWSTASTMNSMVPMNGGPTPSRPAAVSVSQGVTTQMQHSQNLVLNHHHRASPPRPLFSPTSAPAISFADRDTQALRDAYIARQLQQAASPPLNVTSPPPVSLPSPNSTPPRSTLWWGELEPWMDEEYAKQVCNLMGWDPLNIKVPRPAPDPITGRQANNPGYCFLTFPSQVHAAAVLGQANSSNTGTPLTMPNSSKSFTMNWASSVPAAPLSNSFPGQTVSVPGAQNPQYPKEYSIFVGDLAPEVSNSDLVAVFRNPVLGLRNDREPRFIRPFLSCKSAKIMLDPVTGVSRGYGFVRYAYMRPFLWLYADAFVV